MIYIRQVFAIFGLLTNTIPFAQAQVAKFKGESKSTSSEHRDPRDPNHQNLRGDIIHISGNQATEPNESSTNPRHLQLQECRRVTGSASLTVYAGPCSWFPTIGAALKNTNVDYTGWKKAGPSCSDNLTWAMVQWPASGGSGVAYTPDKYMAYCTTSSSACRRITADNVAVYSGPCSTYPYLGKVMKNNQVIYKNWKVTNQAACPSGIWAQIHYPYGSTGMGYVDSSKLSYCCSFSSSPSSSSPNSQPIADFFKRQNITDNKAIAVILGNLQQESYFDPLCCESQKAVTSLDYCPASDGVGILQWTNPDRRDQLFAFCNAKNLNKNDLSSQLQFLVSEWDWTNSNGAQKCFAATGKQMGTVPDDYTLATANSYWYCAAYWTRWGTVGSRVKYANDWLSTCPA